MLQVFGCTSQAFLTFHISLPERGLVRMAKGNLFKLNGLGNLLICVICWAIWIERNNHIFIYSIAYCFYIFALFVKLILLFMLIQLRKKLNKKNQAWEDVIDKSKEASSSCSIHWRHKRSRAIQMNLTPKERLPTSSNSRCA